ncbi:AraC family transcriptional regulator [Sphingobacterium suaedae]|uniref:AraC family transcriptional regulator n=1 Tax=Sphingobacterium suaedae TaxID=1686402 RepID=A0ABW5KE12_9SPHI
MEIPTQKEIRINDKFDSKALFKIAPFDPRKSVTSPHKHNGYLELVFLTATSGTHVIDGRETAVVPPCLLIIKKEQVHHWTLTAPVSGYVILVKKPFVEESLDRDIRKLVEEVSRYSHIPLPSGEYLQALSVLLTHEENPLCIEGLFKAFLAKALEKKSHSIKQLHTSHTLYAQFCALLDEQQLVNHVGHYAQLLHTSQQNLSIACKKSVGLTASEVLAERLIHEAKRLLYYTHKTVAEVAQALHFSDESNFSKYFKRYTGLTPSAFRKL